MSVITPLYKAAGQLCSMLRLEVTRTIFEECLHKCKYICSCMYYSLLYLIEGKGNAVPYRFFFMM